MQLTSRDTVPSRIAVIGDSYTTGSNEGGIGPQGWTARSWQSLARQGFPVTPDVAAEGGAGYGVRGNHGSVFGDLTAEGGPARRRLGGVLRLAQRPGRRSRAAGDAAYGTFSLARRMAPSARCW